MALGFCDKAMTQHSGGSIVFGAEGMACLGNHHPAVTLVNPANAGLRRDCAELLIDHLPDIVGLPQVSTADIRLDFAKHALGNVEPRRVRREEERLVSSVLNC